MNLKKNKYCEIEHLINVINFFFLSISLIYDILLFLEDFYSLRRTQKI